MILPVRLTTATVGDPAGHRPSRSRCTLGTGEGRGKHPASRLPPHRTVETGLVASKPELRLPTGAASLHKHSAVLPDRSGDPTKVPFVVTKLILTARHGTRHRRQDIRARTLASHM